MDKVTYELGAIKSLAMVGDLLSFFVARADTSATHKSYNPDKYWLLLPKHNNDFWTEICEETSQPIGEKASGFVPTIFNFNFLYSKNEYENIPESGPFSDNFIPQLVKVSQECLISTFSLEGISAKKADIVLSESIVISKKLSVPAASPPQRTNFHPGKASAEIVIRSPLLK